MDAYKHLSEECKYLNLVFENKKADEIMITCLLSKIHFAYKCSYINKEQHNLLVKKARLLMYEEA